MLGVGVLMHDIGKIKTPLNVLNKPGRLTDEEMGMMKAHPEHGRKILSRFHEPPYDVIDIAFSHHERIGGGGYPRGLSVLIFPFGTGGSPASMSTTPSPATAAITWAFRPPRH